MSASDQNQHSTIMHSIPEGAFRKDVHLEEDGGVGSPSPILMKLAPVVRLGLKRSLATPFWPIRLVRPAQGPPKWPFFGFLKNGFLAIFFFSQPLQKCLLWVFGRFLAPKCPVFRILELS